MNVRSMWRYPVKSMAGEELSSAQVTYRGLLGDRAYALVDKASNRVATVRTWGASLLNYHATFLTEPSPDAAPPPVRITSPDGIEVDDADRRLSAIFGRNLAVMASAPEGLRIEVPAGTLGGKHEKTTEVPVAGGAPAGTFFDYGSVHLIATSTLDHLQKLYLSGRFDTRRFRPNFVIEMEGEPFVENAWAGRTLALGDQVVLKGSIPCPRCVNTILPQGDLPHDAGILRTLAQHNRLDMGDFGKLPCAGVYAEVVQTGTVSRGDSLRLMD